MEVFLNTFNELPAIVYFAVLFGVVIITSFFLRWLWINILLRFSERTATNLDKYLFTATKGAAQLLLIAAGLNFAWKMYGNSIIQSFRIIPGIDIVFTGKIMRDICFIFLGYSIILFIWKTIFAIIDWYEKDIALKTETQLDEKILPTFRKVIKVIIYIVTIMFISDHFEWQLSKLWAAAGIGTLAIALAAKDTFANIISGVIILIDRPFLVGDRIELIDGTFGDVVDIGLRSTKILSFDNTIHIIPNAEISNQRITNHAYPDYKIKIRHSIGVAYGSDMEKVKSIIGGILTKHSHVLNTPEWGVYFTEFGDSSLDLLVIYWVSNYKNKFLIKDEINMEINKMFEEESIEIPFPQRDVHIRKNG